MADWFIGSASKKLDTPSATWVHTVGFRSETALMALVVCDIDDVSAIDRQSIGMHINLHPIEAVDVMLVASGMHPSITWATCDADTRHTLIHRIVDSIIDALTFGCPAVMRVTPHAIQWRKFDEYPIATLTRHTRAFDARARAHLTTICGDPTLMMRSAVRVADSDIGTDLRHAVAQPVTNVTWQQDASAWVICINATAIVITAGQLMPAINTNVWCMSMAPSRHIRADEATMALLGGQP